MKPFRVLTIDGGGMRGVYSAAFLSGLSELFSREREGRPLDIGKGFDLIAGTSTGAIIACAAAAEIPMTDVVELYKKHGSKIFPLRLREGLRLLPQLLTRPYFLKRGDIALRNALRCVLKDETIGGIYAKRGIALAIPAVEMSRQRAWVFKTAHLKGHRDDKCLLVDACLASSAAPIFRSLASIRTGVDELGGETVFADGGLWANNPVLVGLLDALQMCDAHRPIEVFSLGTCPRPEGETLKKSQLQRGLLGWKFGGKAVQLSLSAQEFAFDNMARLLGNALSKAGRKISVIRFPNGAIPPDLLKYLDLDDTSKQAMERLISQARADVLIAKSACDDKNNSTGQSIAQLFRDMPLLNRSEK